MFPFTQKPTEAQQQKKAKLQTASVKTIYKRFLFNISNSIILMHLFHE